MISQAGRLEHARHPVKAMSPRRKPGHAREESNAQSEPLRNTPKNATQKKKKDAALLFQESLASASASPQNSMHNVTRGRGHRVKISSNTRGSSQKYLTKSADVQKHSFTRYKSKGINQTSAGFQEILLNPESLRVSRNSCYNRVEVISADWPILQLPAERKGRLPPGNAMHLFTLGIETQPHLMMPGNSLRMAQNRRTALSAFSELPRQRWENAVSASSFTAHTDREMLGEAGGSGKGETRHKNTKKVTKGDKQGIV